MKITETRIFLKEGRDKKLKAYASVTFDNVFVVRNIKVIQGSSDLFIAMPSRKMKIVCAQCGFRSEVGDRFCRHCGNVIPDTGEHAAHDVKEDYRDIAHPVTKDFRHYLQDCILAAYQAEYGKTSDPQ